MTHATMDAPRQEQMSPTQVFKRQWEIYQVILDGDYLEHKALYGALQQYLHRKAASRPLRLLDLGCGDSDYISRVIEECGGRALVASYTGVDLSAPAMEISKENINRALKGTDQAEWHTADFLSFATSCQEEYDCILMSFAMHHLTSNEKAEILVQCHRLLQNSGGAFLMVDIMRQPDETLTDYHVRSQRDVDHNWVGLTPEARAPFTDHMLKYDFPETFDLLESISKAAGFKNVTILHAANKGISQCLALES